jgi:hypothetical protein
MPVQIQLRKGTAAQWTAANPTLALGEPGAETDTGRIKCGDGATLWNALPYANAADIAAHSAVTTGVHGISANGTLAAESGVRLAMISGYYFP